MISHRYHSLERTLYGLWLPVRLQLLGGRRKGRAWPGMADWDASKGV